MKVLVWKSHGDISVYDVSTPEKLISRIQDIIVCVDGWGLEKQTELVEGHVAKYPEDIKELTRAFNTIKNAVNPGSHEMFEDLFITSVE
jgi:hypothetical protein